METTTKKVNKAKKTKKTKKKKKSKLMLVYKDLMNNDFKKLDLMQKQLKNIIFFHIVVFFVAIIFSESMIASSGNPTGIIVLITVILGLSFYLAFTKKYKSYRILYKEKVVATVLKSILPDVNYYYDLKVDIQHYLNSRIFKSLIDEYEGDDYFSGKIDKTEFECSEIKSYRYEQNGKGGRYKKVIFHGLFFHGDFNKHLQNETIVVPDYLERHGQGGWFMNFAQKVQALSQGYGELIKLENPVFEKYFAVFGTDPVEARYILTPLIMEKMVYLRKKLNREMYFSFIDGHIYVAIPFRKKLFEPTLFSKCVTFKEMKDMNTLFKNIFQIVNEMDLNRRIWTKE